MSLISIIISIILSIITGLMFSDSYIRFYLEKRVREILGKKLISIKLTSFTNYSDNDGRLLIHCIEVKNCMWFTPVISGIYLISSGNISFVDHAYKPSSYFRSSNIHDSKYKFTLNQLLKEYSKKIVSYSPDNPNLKIDITKTFPLRIIIIYEAISGGKIKNNIALNYQKVLGKLYAAVNNPMPSVSPGSSWDVRIISQDFGSIDYLHFAIPEDLAEIKPLGDSIPTKKMINRPPCLMDVDYPSLTWSLRFKINNCNIVMNPFIFLFLGGYKFLFGYRKIIIKKIRIKMPNLINSFLDSFLYNKIWICKYKKGHPSIKIQ